MHIVIAILLFLVFAYSLGLVLVNSSEVAVNLLFMQAPFMNLGLLLIVSLVLGTLIGILVSLLLFRVVQNRWEISRLKKEKQALQAELEQARIAIDRQTQVPSAEQTIYAEPKAGIIDPP